MGRRIPVVPEDQIVNDFVEKKKPGRRGAPRAARKPTITSVEPATPAREWVPPEGHTPRPLVDDSGVSEIHWADNPPRREPWPQDWPAYALDGPPSQTAR